MCFTRAGTTFMIVSHKKSVYEKSLRVLGSHSKPFDLTANGRTIDLSKTSTSYQKNRSIPSFV